MSEQSHYSEGFEPPQAPPPAPGSYKTSYPPIPPYQTQPPPEPKGMAITALVLGILAIVFSLVPLLAFPLGALAIIFGIISIRRNVAKGMSIAGLITGSVGLLITVVVFIFTFMALQALNDAGEITLEFGEEIERSLEDQNNEFQTELEST